MTPLLADMLPAAMRPLHRHPVGPDMFDVRAADAGTGHLVQLRNLISHALLRSASLTTRA